MNLNGPFSRKCLYCGRRFEAKHGNRQFCPPELLQLNQRDCKITYNNAKAKKLRDETKEFNRAALKNMLILEHYLPLLCGAVTSEELQEKGFDASKSTGVVRHEEDGQFAPVFYKYKLVNVDKDLFLIIKL